LPTAGKRLDDQSLRLKAELQRFPYSGVVIDDQDMSVFHGRL